MSDLRNEGTTGDTDYEIRRAASEEPAVTRSPRPMVPWLVAAVLMAAALMAAYLMLRSPREASTAADTTLVAPPSASPPPAALGGAGAAMDLPPLDQSDVMVRDLVRRLTSHPRVAAWLTTDGLIRNFTVVVNNLADGETPARHLRPLRPESAFMVSGGRMGTVLDPESYHRYDSLASAVSSIDPAAAARLYATLKPRIEDAYRDLGHPGESVDRAVERAIVRLLSTPVIEGPVPLRPVKGTAFAFADPTLESLTAAQRQLLRSGPANVRAAQTWLRAVAEALGIPADHLPAPRTSGAE